MKIHIATPAYDGKVHKQYAQSLLACGEDLGRRGVGVSSTIMRNGAFIEVARNILVRQFLNETDADCLFFIDSDLGFDPQGVYFLASSGLPLTAGVYRQREEKLRYCVHLPSDPYIVKEGWLQANRVATGFMCIQRHVLKEMSRRAPVVKCGDEGKVPFLFRTDTNLEFTGEDFNFCDEYMLLHYEGVFDQPIWVWPNMTFDHDGFKGNFHEFLS